MTDDAPHARSGSGDRPVVTVFRRYLSARPGTLAVALLTTILAQSFRLVPPYLLGVTLDAFFTGNGPLRLPFVPAAWIPATTRGQLAAVAVAFLLTAVALGVATVARELSFRWFRSALLHELRTDAFAATLRRESVAVSEAETGDLATALTEDVTRLRDLCSVWLQRVVEWTTLVAGLLVVMTGLHVGLTLLSLAFLPVMGLLVVGYARLIQPLYDARREAVASVTALVTEVVRGTETVEAFGARDREDARLRDRSRAVRRADRRAAARSGPFDGLRVVVTEAASTVVVVVGGWWALFGSPPGVAPVTTGTFVTFLFYGRWLVDRSAEVGNLVDGYTNARAAASRVVGLLTAEPRVTDPDEPVPLRSVGGAVSYGRVSYTYPTAETPAVRGVTFDAEPGSFVGVVGTTGAGKSTALRLLVRFADPDAGTVQLDGVDVSDCSLAALREAVTYVGQEPFVFDRTVAENVAYGAPEATRGDVRRAARRANAHEFVQHLPDGYDTKVGEDGTRLSGGQRRRLALARALLTDPAVLVVDEPTGGVDAETAGLLRDALRRAAGDRTVIAVAHRLATVRDADRILVFEQGRIVERGRHADLLARDGRYADLWAVQTGETPTADR
ncbi:MAG: ABC transporter ATP-binding protein [Halobaculum sp.]